MTLPVIEGAFGAAGPGVDDIAGAAARGAARGSKGVHRPRSRHPAATPPANGHLRDPGPILRAPRAARQHAALSAGAGYVGSRAIGRGRSSTTRPSSSKGGKSPAHRVVIAEFIACVVLIGITPILTRKTDGTTHLYVANDFIRLSAVCLLFFLLLLLSNNPSTSRIAAAFGGLVTLGALYNASQFLTVLANLFVSAGKAAQPTASG